MSGSEIIIDTNKIPEHIRIELLAIAYSATIARSEEHNV